MLILMMNPEKSLKIVTFEESMGTSRLQIFIGGKYIVLAVCQIVHCSSGLSFLTGVCLIRQSSDTRPPMLDRTDFASWQQRIRLYCRGKENGVNILKSIDEGLFFSWGTIRGPQLLKGQKILLEGAAGYGGAQNRVGNANPGQPRQIKCYNCNGGQDTDVDEDVDEQPIQDLALNVDNVFQADDCDTFDSDVDEAPTAHTTRKKGYLGGGKLCQILKKPCQIAFGMALAHFWLRPKYEGAKYIWFRLKPF
ncbi:hypothetical protein Tco_0514852 [Tanacetum coccineum]